MIIKPMIRNNICLNAHPKGCELLVQKQVEYVRRHARVGAKPKTVLVVGSSTGYGLAARIVAAFGYGAHTVGVAFEKAPTEKRPGTPGWYNSAVFDRMAQAEGLQAETLIGDAFSDEHRATVLDTIAERYGTVDLVVYSLASGLRTDPTTGTTYRSALKPLGGTYTARSLDPFTKQLKEVTIEPATDDEAEATVKVMGGEDWKLWTEALLARKLVSDGGINVAFSYIGPELTKPIYRYGTIGKAKEHLEQAGLEIDELMKSVGGRGFVSVNKAVVTRASAVIPVVPLYMTMLFKVMKDKGLHEDVIEQMTRLFAERLYREDGVYPTDDKARIRIDDWEMQSDVQQEIAELWDKVNGDNLEQLADIAGYTESFLNIHGFGFKEIDYEADVALTLS